MVERTPGFFTSVSIKWKKDYPWEIAVNEPEGQNQGKTPDDDGIQIVPHILDVQVKFTPVHNFIPKKSINSSPFILPKKWAKDGVAATFNDANIGGNKKTNYNPIIEGPVNKSNYVPPAPIASPSDNFSLEPTKINTSGMVKSFRVPEEAIKLPSKQLTTDSFKKAIHDEEIKKAIEQGR